MKAVLIIFLLAASIFAGHHHGNHKCIHDQISQRIPDREVTHIESSEEERNLQSVKPARNMKITYNMDFFSKLSTSPEDLLFKQISEKAVQISIDYLSKLLTIYPKPAGYMKWDKRTRYCGEAYVPSADVLNDKDSDLHLYVTYTDEPQESYLAYAGWCRFLRVYGPTHGQVNFNKGVLSQQNFNDPIVYQDFIQTTIHEIIHVLGFSNDDFPNWVDSNKKPYAVTTTTANVRGYDVTFVKTPNVLKAAQQYYNCTSIQGMPVENQGDAGSAGSHWETTAILDEMMNPASSATNSIMSIFTIALLRDTGFYASVNAGMEEPSFYGKNQGCSFIQGSCSSKKEFCNIGDASTCDFYHHGVSQCSETYFSDQGCSNWQAYSNARCFDTKHYKNTSTNVKYYGVGFGHDSKCFVSSLYSSSFRSSYDQPQCYKFQCTADKKVIVKVGTASAVCATNGQKVTVTGFTGTLTCPSNIEEFCGFKKLCPDHCSSNGYCINGVCMCNKGFSGVNCSKKI